MEFQLGAEELVLTLAPAVAYWLYSGLYVVLGRTEAAAKYRLHSRKEEETKNLVSKKDVVKAVLLQHALQAAISLVVLKLTASEDGSDVETGAGYSGSSRLSSFVVGAARFVVAMFVFDTWQYTMHRCMHWSGYLYRRFHSWHHLVAAPYAFAAQYSHPVDGLLTETLSGAAAFLLSGMSPRAATAFFVFATVKGVDDHCGFMAPWNPFYVAFRNNTVYHDVHHQLGGGKLNFSQPFFVLWDRLLGTYAPYTVQERKGGGFEVRIVKDQMY